MQLALLKKEKNTISFAKLKNRAPTVTELDLSERAVSTTEAIEVWQSIDFVERLVLLSEERGLFMPVRRVFEHGLQSVPEYLLLSLSLAKPYSGNVMMDELLSNLMTLFMGDHANSSAVLQALFKSNKALFIRSICELAKHD